MAQSVSETGAAIVLPSDDPSDSPEVARCLDLARALWDQGQLREAIRLLQRAAAAAEEVGNDLRALALARSAADLTALAGGSVQPAPSADGSGVTAAVTGVSATSTGAASVPRPSLSPGLAPAASAPRPEPAPASGSGAVSFGESAAGSAPNSSPAPVRAPDSARISVGPVGVDKRGTTPPRANGAAAQFPIGAREMKVSVRRSVLDETLFVVRPLVPDGRLPPGARVATLVFSEEE